ncbi:hypothetical protein MHYP_G00356350 [Metynnis hypsauchen]
MIPRTESGTLVSWEATTRGCSRRHNWATHQQSCATGGRTVFIFDIFEVLVEPLYPEGHLMRICFLLCLPAAGLPTADPPAVADDVLVLVPLSLSCRPPDLMHCFSQTLQWQSCLLLCLLFFSLLLLHFQGIRHFVPPWQFHRQRHLLYILLFENVLLLQPDFFYSRNTSSCSVGDMKYGRSGEPLLLSRSSPSARWVSTLFGIKSICSVEGSGVTKYTIPITTACIVVVYH